MLNYFERTIRTVGVALGIWLIVLVAAMSLGKKIGWGDPITGLTQLGYLISGIALAFPWRRLNSRLSTRLLLFGVLVGLIMFGLGSAKVIGPLDPEGSDYLNLSVMISLTVLLFLHLLLALKKHRQASS